MLIGVVLVLGATLFSVWIGIFKYQVKFEVIKVFAIIAMVLACIFLLGVVVWLAVLGFKRCFAWLNQATKEEVISLV